MMGNPFGIEQVDVGGIIGAYQSGQDRRRTLIERQRADDKTERLTQLYQKLSKKLSNPKGGDPVSSGVAGAYAQLPAAPSRTIDMPELGAVPLGQPQAPAAPAQSAMEPHHQSFMQQHGDTISEIMGIDSAAGCEAAN
jgi:hypothetical protein